MEVLIFKWIVVALLGLLITVFLFGVALIIAIAIGLHQKSEQLSQIHDVLEDAHS